MEYLGGFIVYSKAFDGLKGDFPIGFLIWKTHNDTDDERYRPGEIQVDIFDRNMNPMGQKPYFPLSEDQYLNLFLRPTGELTEEFKNDCLIWMLFHNSNGTAAADGIV